ncbi:MAG: Asp23/Gls24 family envelope stress response protein, partial [Syntrophomonadaceae bacterium]|nr:Asp23/Gls24 family envelope stress response protein [Syntrophomonadaceae bacterium]
MEGSKSEMTNEFGIVRIADEVVSTVAGMAVADVEGVAAMSGGGWGTDLVERLGKKNYGKGIKVEVGEDSTSLDIYLVVEFGYAIPQLAESVQKEVKLAIESMIGLKVSHINIHVV